MRIAMMVIPLLHSPVVLRAPPHPGLSAVTSCQAVTVGYCHCIRDPSPFFIPAPTTGRHRGPSLKEGSACQPQWDAPDRLGSRWRCQPRQGLGALRHPQSLSPSASCQTPKFQTFFSSSHPCASIPDLKTQDVRARFPLTSRHRGTANLSRPHSRPRSTRSPQRSRVAPQPPRNQSFHPDFATVGCITGQPLPFSESKCYCVLWVARTEKMARVLVPFFFFF